MYTWKPKQRETLQKQMDASPNQHLLVCKGSQLPILDQPFLSGCLGFQAGDIFSFMNLTPDRIVCLFPFNPSNHKCPGNLFLV